MNPSREFLDLSEYRSFWVRRRHFGGGRDGITTFSSRTGGWDLKGRILRVREDETSVCVPRSLRTEVRRRKEDLPASSPKCECPTVSSCPVLLSPPSLRDQRTTRFAHPLLVYRSWFVVYSFRQILLFSLSVLNINMKEIFFFSGFWFLCFESKMNR